MRAICVPLLLSISVGCAARQPEPTLPLSGPRTSELTALQEKSDAQARRITELEARLGMLEAEAREMRALVDQFSLLFLQRRMLEMWWRKFGGSHV